MNTDIFTKHIIELSKNVLWNKSLKEAMEKMNTANQGLFMITFADLTPIAAIYMVAYHRTMRELEEIEEMEKMLERE